jgi:hypothetical protein
MPLLIANKRIHQRGKEIRKFTEFINTCYDIPDPVHIHILDFPCVYDSDGEPAFGVFYKEDKIHIEIANDVEFYEKAHKRKLGEKYLCYLVLSTLAHEVCHYFQYRDKKPIVENYVSYNAAKLLADYAIKRKSMLTSEYVAEANVPATSPGEDLYALDPLKILRKEAGIR